MTGSAGALDAQRFERLLSFLGAADTGGYRRIHARLESFFRWKGLGDGASLADETLDRAARRLADDAVRTEAPMPFLLGVARFVAMEAQRREVQVRTAEQSSGVPPPEDEAVEAAVSALEGCLEGLLPAERALVLTYYREGSGRARIESRQQQADSLGIGLNALRIRAFRLRERLEQCISTKLAETHSSTPSQEGE
jgi:DNA-directed RNA polymerase specialized sigma24 family protein